MSELTDTLEDLYNKNLEHEKRILILEIKVDSLNRSIEMLLRALKGE